MLRKTNVKDIYLFANEKQGVKIVKEKKKEPRARGETERDGIAVVGAR